MNRPAGGDPWKALKNVLDYPKKRPKKSTPNRPRTGSTSIKNQTKICPKSIQNRPRKDPKRAKKTLKLFQKKPTTNPKSSNNQPAIDQKWDQNQCKVGRGGASSRSMRPHKPPWGPGTDLGTIFGAFWDHLGEAIGAMLRPC